MGTTMRMIAAVKMINVLIAVITQSYYQIKWEITPTVLQYLKDTEKMNAVIIFAIFLR